MKQLVKPIIASLLMASAISAEAIIQVSLIPTTQEVRVGEPISLGVFYDTNGDTTLGGAFSVNFDNSAFDFLSFEFDSGLGDDEFFRIEPQLNTDVGNTFDLGFGSFSFIAAGTGSIGTLTFQSSQQGNFDFTLNGPSVAGRNSFNEGASYINAQVNVAPVPLPAAAWLLMSGISGLGLFARRKPIT